MSPVTVKEDKGKAILAIYIAAKDDLAALHYYSVTRRSALVFKGVCHTGGEALKRKLVHSVVLIFMA